MILLYFKANQNYYAENLCVERDKAESKCAASCCLTKMLEENQSDNQEDSFTYKFQEVRFLLEIILDAKIHPPSTIQRHNYKLYTLLFSNFSHPVFRPPIV